MKKYFKNRRLNSKKSWDRFGNSKCNSNSRKISLSVCFMNFGSVGHELYSQMSSCSSEHQQKFVCLWLFDVTKIMCLYLPCTYGVNENRNSRYFLTKWDLAVLHFLICVFMCCFTCLVEWDFLCGLFLTVLHQKSNTWTRQRGLRFRKYVY